MADVIVYRGEEKAVVFYFTANGTLLDLTGGTVWAEIWHPSPSGRDKLQLTFTEGSGLTVLDPTPEAANPGEKQEPHASILLTVEMTAALPLGAIVKLKRWFTDSLGRVFLAGSDLIEVRDHASATG